MLRTRDLGSNMVAVRGQRWVLVMRGFKNQISLILIVENWKGIVKLANLSSTRGSEMLSYRSCSICCDSSCDIFVLYANAM